MKNPASIRRRRQEMLFSIYPGPRAGKKDEAAMNHAIDSDIQSATEGYRDFVKRYPRDIAFASADAFIGALKEYDVLRARLEKLRDFGCFAKYLGLFPEVPDRLETFYANHKPHLDYVKNG